MNVNKQDQDYLKSLTVLYVEDDEDALKLISRFLSRNAGTVITAENGAKGLDAYRKHHPAVIITDIQMPIMDGLTMAREIRQLDASIPIIVMTAFDQSDYLMKSLNIGIDKYIIKPVAGSQLYDALLTCAHRMLVDEQLKQAQAMLKDERQRLANIIEGTRAGTWEWNVKTGETIFNERWAEIIGYKLTDIDPISIDTWIKFTHPNDLVVSNDLLEKHFNKKLPYYECEVRMRHKDGHWVWVHDRGKVATWTDDEKPLVMSGTHQDITDRKRLEEGLKQREEQYRLLIETLPLAVLVHTHGKIVYVNRAFLTMFKASSLGEVVGMRVIELVPPELIDTVEERRRIMTEENRIVPPMELNLRCMDGTIITAVSTPMPVIFQEQSAVLAALYDITESKRNEIELQKAHKLLHIQVREIADLQAKLQEWVIRNPLPGLFKSR